MTQDTNKTSVQWYKTGGISNNEVLKGNGFYISFVPNASNLGPWSSDEPGGSETALKGPDGFLILNGDYRTAYEKLVPQGYAACKRFYDQQSAHANSSWSDK